MFDKPMEHRKVEGGGHWLAFAEGEARRLRATGLSYVSKRLPMPDGATVEVRIEPNHTYIHITGGGSDIGMDSGVVAVHNIAPTHPDLYRTGTLYETDYVRVYHAQFHLQDGDPPRLKLPRDGNKGQFAGILSASGKRFTGKVPIDERDAKSFRPSRNTEGVENAADATLAEKKNIAVLCPASMFTGKTRLWVQALYGAHLSEKEGAGRDLPFEYVPGNRPSIRIKNRFFNPDAPGPDHRVHLTTGDGVHLDKTTGNHWLFSFTSGMRAYKLKAPASVEKLRRWLIHPVNDLHPDQNNPLSEEDREHLEAYILSQCLPYGDTTIMPNPWVTEGSGALAQPWCMGYSWHWNWSGTAAIARVNEVFDQDLTNSAMRTSTYEVEVTKVGDDLFSVMQLHSELPLDWSVHRTRWTITEPEWGSGTQSKMTPKLSIVFASTATFYSYYERDALINCAVAVTYENEQPASVTFTNGATGGPDGSNCFTVGTNEGARFQLFGAGPQMVAKFYIGRYSTPALTSGWSQTRWTLEVRNKSFGEWSTGYSIASDEHTAGPWNFAVSNDDGTNAHTELNTNYLYVDRAIKYCQFESVSTVGREEEHGQATIVVPLYDAQAVYVQASTANTKTVDSQTTHVLYHGGGLSAGEGFLVRSATAIAHIDPPESWNYFSHAQSRGANAADGHFLQSTNYEPDEPILTGSNEEKLVCSAGVIDATFQNLGAFHDNAEESVSSGFNTLTGTKTNSDGVAIAPTYITTEGAPDTNAPVLVGWV